MEIRLDTIKLEIKPEHISKGGNNRKLVYKYAIGEITTVPFLIGAIGLYYGEPDIYSNHTIFPQEVIIDLNKSDQLEPKTVRMLVPVWVQLEG